MAATFHNIMHAVTSPMRLESEDPRWMQLLAISSIDLLTCIEDGDTFPSYCVRLIENNPTTGNLLLLIEQTSSRLRQLNSKKLPPNSQTIDQCCASLHLLTVILHHLISCLTAAQLKEQLHLSLDWPGNLSVISQFEGDSNFFASSTAGQNVVENIIDDVAVTINTPPSRHPWMGNVKYFCCNFLLCLCSTQLYHSHEFSNSDSFVSFTDTTDIFLNYLYRKGELQLRTALSQSHTDSRLFSNSLPVQLVRGLVTCALSNTLSSKSNFTNLKAKNGDVTQQKNATEENDSSKATSLIDYSLIKELKYKYSRKLTDNSSVSASELVGRAREFTSSALSHFSTGGAGGASSTRLALSVQQLLVGILLLIPFGALQQFLLGSQASSPSAAIIHDDVAHIADTADFSQWTPCVVPNSMNLPDNPCVERCLNVLLVLLHNRRSSNGQLRPNPFREAFCLLHDPTLDSEATSDEEAGGNNEQAAHALDYSGSAFGSKDASNLVLMMATRIHINFASLLQNVAMGLSSESCGLFLYSMLVLHPSFIEVIHSTGSTELIFSHCLIGLYDMIAAARSDEKNRPGMQQASSGIMVTSKSINQLYIFVVNILLMVQDKTLVPELARIKPNASWYRHRHLADATLMDLTVLTLLRTVTYATFRLRDTYLLTNACAILQNLAPYVNGLLPFTSERLVKVAKQLCSRIVNGQVPLNNGSSNFSARSSYESKQLDVPSYSVDAEEERMLRATDMGTGIDELKLLTEAVATVLTFIDITIRSQKLLANVQIMYALIHEFDALSALLENPVISYMLSTADQCYASHTADQPNSLSSDNRNIPNRIVERARVYMNKIEILLGEDRDRYLSAGDAIQALREEISSQQAITVQDSGVPNTTLYSALGNYREKYCYRESENPEEFFVPCVWAAALRTSPELPWRLFQTTLIDPITTGFVALHPPPNYYTENTVENSVTTEDTAEVANEIDQV